MNIYVFLQIDLAVYFCCEKEGPYWRRRDAALFWEPTNFQVLR